MILSLAGGSLLTIFWMILCKAIFIRLQIKFVVMGIIESHLGIPGHGHFRELREELFGKRITIQNIYEGVFYLYVVVVIIIGAYEYGPELPELYGNNPYILASVVIIFISLFIASVIASVLVIRKANSTIKQCNSKTLEEIITSLKKKKEDSQSCD